MISSVSYSNLQLPELPKPSSRDPQSAVVPAGGDTVNVSSQALATAIVDAQVGGALDVSQP